MRSAIAIVALTAGWISSSALAQEPFTPERLTVESGVAPGPRLFLASGSRVHLLELSELKYQGQFSLSAAFGSKIAISDDGKTLYTAATYFSRGWDGTREDVVVAYDVESMKPKFEIPIAPRNAPSVGIAKEYAALSSNGRWLLVQNATPATSVTVVDLRAQKQTGEIPTPGCWALYPSAVNPQKFSVLCGDGKLITYTLNAEGSAATSSVSEQIFDAGADPLFIDAERNGDTWIFISYNGNIYEVNAEGAVARLSNKFSITEGVSGKWGPGGSQLLAYLPDSGVLYVLMHDNPYEGSFGQPAKEIWAVDMRKRVLLSRTTAKPVRSMTVTGGDKPMLYAFGDGGVLRYEITRSAGHTVREDKFVKLGENASYLEVR